MNPAQDKLTDDLHDALLANGVTPTHELLEAILWAVGASTITERQFAVLRLAISGANDKTIADELSISARAVEEHWKEIRRRLGIETRLQLGAAVVMTLWKPTGCQAARPGVICTSNRRNRHQRPNKHAGRAGSPTAKRL
jgi:DNA-binding CsgD family transcriptional regulator